MSHPIHDRLRQLEADVQHLQVLPAAAVRARGRRRGRRQLATGLVAVAVLATTAGVTATREWPHQRGAVPVPAAAPSTGDRAVTGCHVALPDTPAAVRVRVLSNGVSGGLAATTATELRKREFTVLPDTAGPRDVPAGAPADVRYGPSAIGAATLLRAELSGSAQMSFDPGRNDNTIDLTLGVSFTRLASITEVNQALAAVGEPSAPPQCSAAPSRTPGR